MLIVACVYWEGKNNVYSPKWVDKLRLMVDNNLHIPYKFVCLSNVDVPCERIPLERNWKGWWSKIELFKPGQFEDRVLYLDLDVLILDDLQPIIDFPSSFAIIKAKPRRKIYINRKEGLEIKRYNSSVMVFEPVVTTPLYTDINDMVIRKYRSDQDWIGQRFPALSTFPKEWIKKLGDCENGFPTEGMKVMLCMPDKNEEASLKYQWIKDLWV
jgi:alpha-N-acetylglucosamine transferase